MLTAEDPHAIRLIDFGLAINVRLLPNGKIDPTDNKWDCAGTQVSATHEPRTLVRQTPLPSTHSHSPRRGHHPHHSSIASVPWLSQAYRAPEVSSGEYEPAKVDIWAMGIILFSLVAGFFPLKEAVRTSKGRPPPTPASAHSSA